MTTPLNELHSLIIYILFGYTLLLPLVLIGLKVLGITSPLQRMRIYLLAFLTPPAAFVIYHTVLAKRCESGLPPVWSEGAFHFLCVISEGMLRATLPLAGLLLFLGTLKAASAALMIRRLDREALAKKPDSDGRVTGLWSNLCRKIQIPAPRVIFSSRDGFAAFTTGIFKPVLVVNEKVTAGLENRELEALLSHELVHIRQKDTFKSWLLHLVRDLTFINPISSILLKNYLLEKEALCDRKAASLAGQETGDYAAALLRIWRAILDRRPESFGLVSSFSGGGSGLERRVGALLGSREEDGRGHTLTTILLGAILFVTTLLFLGLIC
jgi:Zn-dependent protease with chaperone function